MTIKWNRLSPQTRYAVVSSVAVCLLGIAVAILCLLYPQYINELVTGFVLGVWGYIIGLSVGAVAPEGALVVITRRDFIKKLGLVGMFLPAFGLPKPDGKVGYISVQTHPECVMSTKVFLDGVNITSDCFAADDIRGMAWCYCVDEHGGMILEWAMVFGRWGQRPKTEIRRGNIVIRLPNVG